MYERIIGAVLATALAGAAGAAYPERPIQLIHGFGAGGNADTVSRLVARHLQAALGQPVVVEIKSGAGGVVASSYVAKAEPDGYTLVMLTGGHTVSAAVNKSLPYDPVADFQPISTVTAFPFVVSVKADNPARTLADLLAAARARPGTVSFSSVGVGSTQHLTGELLAATAGVQMLHVPYRGGAAPVQAVLAGDVNVLVDTATVAAPQLKAGTLRALAITSAKPWPLLPGVPVAADTVSGFQVYSWLGIAAPAKTPGPIVDRLHAALAAMLQDPAFRKAVNDIGSEPSGSSPAQMRTMIESEIARWKKVVEQANIVAN
ncbi:tripartite tricarboxylate transporter substrate binding protein [Pigmentiphaga sp.]|uniref:tripartite tricarboxylate transporter substrate binding protein n=1 Tax=Pigmentiphaga sp. TaxID=1977564 RepID=UPI00128D5976|nr:tripartite tricarboxylate transporter substrate binding protein [Pigmentiphaga sp.]MPS25488.1 tripartite tricarboxylate transporter substrate binding protein [Alcaligenaceae bacterium SAGV5]MPS54102.1 tripartite tricarboxylate transporter substrate binding protein [Alcaligenaceae bacterium SAGV3]MPT58801.1 tripartite tricarboxylate transporter substrate binding protein [Alcaligenaceae bacterium]